jgi:hypothetical protein
MRSLGLAETLQGVNISPNRRLAYRKRIGQFGQRSETSRLDDPPQFSTAMFTHEQQTIIRAESDKYFSQPAQFLPLKSAPQAQIAHFAYLFALDERFSEDMRPSPTFFTPKSPIFAPKSLIFAPKSTTGEPSAFRVYNDHGGASTMTGTSDQDAWPHTVAASEWAAGPRR